MNKSMNKFEPHSSFGATIAFIKTFIALVILAQVGFIGWSCHSIATGTNNAGIHVACLATNLLFSMVNVKNLMRPQQDWFCLQES